MIGSLISGFLKSGAAGKAANEGTQAEAAANAMQERMYSERRQDMEPWRAAGLSALAGMGGADFQRDFGMSDFQNDPGYQFRMQEGQKALERSAAARGGLQSGGTLKALARYGQDFASNEYQNAYNRFNADRDRRFGRLSSLANLGFGATGAAGDASRHYGDTFGANTWQGAGARAGGHIAKANAWSDAAMGVQKSLMDLATMGAGGGAR